MLVDSSESIGCSFKNSLSCLSSAPYSSVMPIPASALSSPLEGRPGASGTIGAAGVCVPEAEGPAPARFFWRREVLLLEAADGAGAGGAGRTKTSTSSGSSGVSAGPNMDGLSTGHVPGDGFCSVRRALPVLPTAGNDADGSRPRPSCNTEGDSIGQN